jgi:hypothetical protein
MAGGVSSEYHFGVPEGIERARIRQSDANARQTTIIDDFHAA